MKRIFTVVVIIVLVLCFVACSKQQMLVEKDIKVTFSVAPKDGFSLTRAVKEDWADGDKILIAFGTGSQVLLNSHSLDNTMTLEYNASDDSWSMTKNNWGETLNNSTSGQFIAVHYRGDVQVGYNNGMKCGLKNFKGGELLTMSGNYTITDDEMQLPQLVLRMKDNAVQFSVKDLKTTTDSYSARYDEWRLYVRHNQNQASGWTLNSSLSQHVALSPVVAYNSNSDVSIYYNNGDLCLLCLDQQEMLGVVNGNDLSFCGYLDSDNDNATMNYMFLLENKRSSKMYYYNYRPSPFEKFTGRSAYLLPPLPVQQNGSFLSSGCKWTML